MRTYPSGAPLNSTPGEAAAILSMSKLPAFSTVRLPQPRPEISGLRHVADDGFFAPHLLKRRNEGLVVGIVERLEILHAGIGADDVLAADAEDLVLGDRDRHQGLLGEIDARRLQLLVKGDVGAADDDRVDDVRFYQLHLVDDGVELRAAEREILLADDLEFEHVLDVLARDLVGRARPDIV